MGDGREGGRWGGGRGEGEMKGRKEGEGKGEREGETRSGRIEISKTTPSGLQQGHIYFNKAIPPNPFK